MAKNRVTKLDPPNTAGFFSIGGLALGAAKAGALTRVYNYLGRRFGHFCDEGAGTLTKFQAAELVARLKGAIDNPAGVQGYEDLGYDSYYQNWKDEKYPGSSGKAYYVSGQLQESIKVLNRRLAGGKRGHTAGISQNKYVDSKTSPGKRLPLATIVYDLEFGHRTGKARMLLSLATADFLRRHAPSSANGFFLAFMDQVDEHKAKIMASVMIDQKLPDGTVIPAGTIGAEQAMNEGMDPVGREVSTKEWEGLDKEAYLKGVSGKMSAKEIAYWNEMAGTGDFGDD